MDKYFYNVDYFYLLNISLLILFNDFATVIDVTLEPLTLSMVLPISNIGSIASIPEANGKYAPSPIPDNTTDTDIVAVPGRPAIPRELIDITITSVI